MSNIIKFTLTFGVSLDLLSKYIAIILIPEKISIYGNLAYLQVIKNPGIAFGIEVPSFFLKILTLILIIGIFYYYNNERKSCTNKKLLDSSFGLILAGAIGNGIERIFFSEVTDFIGIQYFSIFNLADSFITLGAILYIYILFRYNKS